MLTPSHLAGLTMTPVFLKLPHTNYRGGVAAMYIRADLVTSVRPHPTRDDWSVLFLSGEDTVETSRSPTEITERLAEILSGVPGGHGILSPLNYTLYDLDGSEVAP